MPKDYPRTRRVGEQIQRELAMLVREEIKDPRLGMTTVSAVHVSRDFSHAKVYITVLGDAEVQRQSLEVLRRAAGFLRRELGRRMLTRTVPELHFVYDESIERGSRLDALIEQAVTEDKARHRD
ncbi:ribosome-binding factor A [Thiohalobacter thiocyanaticus]|uniref:Ribosome-binding factor A n=1 Tax=Thiohalobacter thiocyanaticus TaxID=585455 RepID=A0A1Z4VR85_9GAMM|nr:30S ribosome-binding factor RbfA [Thiohalobacter thiocyanaticus]BAZ94137.1 ribosome-binding factor A [Thiohalobacter thiocyanaticus]